MCLAKVSMAFSEKVRSICHMAMETSFCFYSVHIAMFILGLYLLTYVWWNIVQHKPDFYFAEFWQVWHQQKSRITKMKLLTLPAVFQGEVLVLICCTIFKGKPYFSLIKTRPLAPLGGHWAELERSQIDTQCPLQVWRLPPCHLVDLCTC
jgi:hypothetical protein